MILDLTMILINTKITLTNAKTTFIDAKSNLKYLLIEVQNYSFGR